MGDLEPIQEVVDSQLDNLENKPSHGGPRPNSGRPKGKLNAKTLEALKVKEAFNQRILRNADRLFNAQMNLAVGEQVLMVKVKERDSKGKVLRTYFEQVDDVELIKQYLDYTELNEGENPDDDEHYYFLTTKPANNQALDSLVNRALGKVPEKLEVGGGFFNQSELIIKVIGSKHADIDIGDNGQIIDGEPAPGAESQAGPGSEAPEPSSGS